MLIGGFKHFVFSRMYGIILPIDEYFSRWLKPPTSYITMFNHVLPGNTAGLYRVFIFHHVSPTKIYGRVILKQFYDAKWRFDAIM